MFKGQLTNEIIIIVVEFVKTFTKSAMEEAKQRPLNLPSRNEVVPLRRVELCGIEESLPKAKGLE